MLPRLPSIAQNTLSTSWAMPMHSGLWWSMSRWLPSCAPGGNSWPTRAKTSRSAGHSDGPMKSSGFWGPTFHSLRDSWQVAKLPLSPNAADET
jgi:hypothetical protein